MKFLKLLVVVVLIALGALYIGIAALTQKELTMDAIISIVLGALFIAAAYGVYKDAKGGYYLALAVSLIGLVLALVRGLPIAVALYATLAIAIIVLMKKGGIKAEAPIAKQSVFINERRFIKRKS
jgi:lysylphosphatidylglycerol synthetase-like protein (DUF2156 family)